MVASWEARNDEELRNLKTGSEVTGEDIRVNNNLKLKLSNYPKLCRFRLNSKNKSQKIKNETLDFDQF